MTDEEAILREAVLFTEAWNTHDADLLSGFFTEDARRVGAFGDVQVGREEIKAAFEKLLSGSMKDAIIRQEHGIVRLLSEDLAIWQAGIELVPGDNMPVMKGYAVQLYRKTGDRWLILETHPKFYPTRP